MARKLAVKETKLRPTVPALPAPAAAAASGIPVPQGVWCWLAYVAALVYPASGLTLGVLFSGSADKAARRFGITCFVLSAVGWGLAMLTGWLGDLGLMPGSDGDKYTENYY
jgi:hypothetical protein